MRLLYHQHHQNHNSYHIIQELCCQWYNCDEINFPQKIQLLTQCRVTTFLPSSEVIFVSNTLRLFIVFEEDDNGQSIGVVFPTVK